MIQLAHSDLTGQIIGAAIEVHRRLGPGFLESIYQQALELELNFRQVPFRPQLEVKVFYRDAEVGEHILDLVVAKLVVVELKAVKAFEDAHVAVMRSYLRAVNLRYGLILNFAQPTLRIRRVIT